MGRSKHIKRLRFHKVRLPRHAFAQSYRGMDRALKDTSSIKKGYACLFSEIKFRPKIGGRVITAKRVQILFVLSRMEFPITITSEKAMASAPIMGLRKPHAAMGMATTL